MKTLKKIIKIAPVVVIVAALVFGIVSRTKEHSAKHLMLKRKLKMKFKNVGVVQLAKGDVLDYVWAQGKTEPIKTVLLKSELSKKLMYVFVTLGQWVEEGDILFCLDDAELLAAYREAKAAVAKAQANLEYAKRDYENKLSLSKQGFNEITEDVLIRAKQSLTVAKAAVEQTDAAAMRAESNLKKTLIRAPFTGVITELFHETAGALVSINEPLARISDITSLKIKTALLAEDIRFIKIGTKIKSLDLGYKKLAISGEVTGVSAQALETGIYELQATIKNPGVEIPVFKQGRDATKNILKNMKTLKLLGLKAQLPPANKISLTLAQIPAGAVVRIKIPKAILKNCFVLPFDAVIHKDGIDYVCVIRREENVLTIFGTEDFVVLHKADFVPVNLYKVIDDKAIVLSKRLSAGLLVAVDGQRTLTNGEVVLVH